MRRERISKNIRANSQVEGWYLTFSFLGAAGIFCTALLMLSWY